METLSPQEHVNNLGEYLAEDNLSPQQESFCRYYTQNPELYGNGTLCYAEAYGYDLDSLDKEDSITQYLDGEEIMKKYLNPFTLGKEKYDKYNSISSTHQRIVQESTYKKAYNTCSVCASQLLRTTKIQKRLQAIYLAMMDDDTIDSVLSSIISNPREQSKDRISAIKEYNALKQRIIKKLDLSSLGERINTSDPSTIALAEEYERRLKEQLG